LYDWSDIVGNQYLACPTNVKLYVDNSANILDVTPLRRSVTLGLNPIYTYAGNSSEELLGDNVIGMAIDFTGDNFYIRTEQSDIEQPNVIVITDVNHGAVVGDYITISGSTSVNGITAAQINKEFVVFQVIDANSYAVVTTGYATATGAGGGASVVVKYQFHPGISSSVTYAGWGSGPWGGISGSYGWGFGPDTTISTYYTGLWTVDNYGEDMIACPRNVTNAVTLGNTPISTSNTSNVVTVTQVNHALSNGMAIVIGGVT
jgi:hypothetical protein